MSALIDWTKPSLFIALAAIAFNPTAWNLVARNEYRNKTITKLCNGNARKGCYYLAASIWGFGILRDSLVERALRDQPHHAILPEPVGFVVSALLFIVGQMLVVTSTYALGITGTFLGDYFGILMDKRVEGFPFNVLENPMYVGSTMCFLAGAIWYQSPAGLIITAYVWLVYLIALRFEGPFTSMIYSNRAANAAASSKTASKKEL